MTLESIVPCAFWQHKATRQRVSLFGALPHPIESFEKVTRGFTTVWSNGTRGHGAKPFESLDEARAFVESYNARRMEYGRAPVNVNFP